jgi:hypothetical protein
MAIIRISGYNHEHGGFFSSYDIDTQDFGISDQHWDRLCSTDQYNFLREEYLNQFEILYEQLN